MKWWKSFSTSFAVAALLAGCATIPAPVVNHSFGGSNSQPASATTLAATPQAPRSGARTFGLGGHANGSVSTAGYTVAPGDTLYSIAFAHGMDVRQLAALNDIPSPYTIHPGQVLKLKASPVSQTPGAAMAAIAPSGSTTSAGTLPAGAQPSAPVFGPVTIQPMTANGVEPANAAPASVIPATAASSIAPIATVAPPPAPPAIGQPVGATMPTPPLGATRSVAGITWRWPASGEVLDGFHSGGGDGAGLDIDGNVGDPVRAAASGTVVYSGNGLIGYGELIIIKHNDTYLSAYGHNSKRLVKEGEHVDAGQEIALMGASGAPRVELHFEIRRDGKPVDPLAYLPQR